MGDINIDGYQRLANAIITTAAKDYREALKKLRKHPKSQTGLDTKRECERFFDSRLYGALTSLDGQWLKKKLREEVGYDS